MEIILPVSILYFLSSSSCTDVTNCIRVGRSLTELWRYVDSSRWRPYRPKYTFVFWFYDVSPSERQRTICVSNFDQISQSTAKILLFPVAENKRLPYLESTPSFDELFTVIGMWFCTDLLRNIEDQRQSYDVILILQDGGYSVANLLSLSGLATSDMSGGLKLSAYQLSTRYLNALPICYYFRFRFWPFHCLIGMRFYTGLPNFMHIGWSPTELWRHIQRRQHT